MLLQCTNLVERATETIADSALRELGKFVGRSAKEWLAQEEIINSINATSAQFLEGNKIKELVFDKGTDSLLQDIFDSVINLAKNIKARVLNQDVISVLFAGPPGGGKTETVRQIIKKVSDIYGKTVVYFFPGSYLKQYKNSDGIAAIERVMESITKDIKNGKIVILGIDEADAMLGNDKDEVNGRSDILVSLLAHISHLTSMIQENQNPNRGTFILLCTTNLPRILNEAIGRRFTFCVNLPTISQATIKQILTSELQKTAKQFGKLLVDNGPWKVDVSQECIDFIAANSHGMMGGDIANIVQAAFTRARRFSTSLTDRMLLFMFIIDLHKRLLIVHKAADADVKTIIDNLWEQYEQWEEEPAQPVKIQLASKSQLSSMVLKKKKANPKQKTTAVESNKTTRKPAPQKTTNKNNQKVETEPKTEDEDQEAQQE